MALPFLETRTLNLKRRDDREGLRSFLETRGLVLDEDLDYAAVLTEGDTIVASGCAEKNILKCIAVGEKYQNRGLINTLISHLRLRACQKGVGNLFLFTKPENERIFTDLGFTLLARAPEAVLMESNPEGLPRYLASLHSPSPAVPSASIVMNANPFTLGHRHLLEKACGENERVHLFVVREEASDFPFPLRMELIRRGSSDLKNLFIHEGGDYIISRATFPSYFLKDRKIINESHTRIDLDLFSRHIAPALSINRRYVGEEPFDPTTAAYNRMMKKILPDRNIQVIEIPRKTGQEDVISASHVRKAMAEGRWETIKQWVAPTSYEILCSPEGRAIAEKIKSRLFPPKG